MIKQIQLRGISRTPSDRATQDGGCAESLNVHIADSELSPTLSPEDRTQSLGLPASATKDYIYIHKGNGYTNYITLESTEIGAFVRGTHEVIAYMEQDETMQSVTSLGNTLVVMGSKHPYYALYKDDHYIFLGSKIPLPTIKIWPEPVAEEISQVKGFFTGGIESEGDKYFVPADVVWTKETWNAKATEAEASGKRFAGRDNMAEAEPGENEPWDIMTGMKEFATQAYAEAKTKNVLINQVMVNYGARLFNGSYISSVPILMPGGFESPFFCRYLRYAEVSGNTFTQNTEYIQYGARYPYRIKAQMLDFDSQTLSLWQDIIMSIDFFMTPVIPYDLTKEKVMYVSRELKASNYDTVGRFNYMELQPGSSKYARGYLSRVLAYGSGDLRKVEAFSTEGSERFTQLREEGVELDITDYIADQDLLLTQPALSDYSYDMRNAERVASGVSNMNNRMLMSGVTETVPSGLQVFPAAPCRLVAGEEKSLTPYIDESYRTGIDPLGTVDINMRIELSHESSDLGKAISDFSFPEEMKYVQLVYHIQGGEKYTVRGRLGGQDGFVESADGNTAFFGFLLFPDIRCEFVDIYLSYDEVTWYKQTYEMREHPRLNCSYMYAGADKNLLWEIGGVQMAYAMGQPHYFDSRDDNPPADVSKITESRIEKKDNVLMLSDLDNPWFVPLENQYQLQATQIIGTALATKALSTGQFGQFPLYVFTDNGIWAMQMSGLGTFASAHAVAMDVAMAGTILPLDQAVAFVTAKGLMLLTGSDIQNLSPNMNGVHYTVEPDAARLIRGSAWRELLGAVTDDSHFMEFMRTAQLAYDYTGERIICFNRQETYMYVYMLRTASWHKMSMPEGAQMVKPLNSYPDTLLSIRTEQAEGRILSFSTPLDVTSTENLKGVIATRPFDLGEPDIRKTIKSIRIRGQYNRNDVQYILMGSMDGINWGVLPSLRGGSYKLFRLILLTSLTPTERISWIDIDYESRFGNKLR